MRMLLLQNLSWKCSGPVLAVLGSQCPPKPRKTHTELQASISVYFLDHKSIQLPHTALPPRLYFSVQRPTVDVGKLFFPIEWLFTDCLG